MTDLYHAEGWQLYPFPDSDTTEASILVIRQVCDSTATDNIAKILYQSSISDRDLSATSPTEAASVPGASVTSVKEETPATDVEETEELCVTEGDRVAIKVGDEKLKELQQHYGGCTARMIRVSPLLLYSFILMLLTFVTVHTQKKKKTGISRKLQF